MQMLLLTSIFLHFLSFPNAYGLSIGDLGDLERRHGRHFASFHFFSICDLHLWLGITM